ncbi:MAG: LacI family transcriptional regulator [Oleiphilaceae bacterium]|jgi:LacI family transcriptional regulator
MSTVRDIAAKAGVSIATISRALNEPDNVSRETLLLVEEAMRELNYKRKVAMKKRTNLFGVIFPNICNPFFAELLDVIENEAFHHGRCVLFFNSRHNLRQEKICIHECENHGVDGVFLVPHCVAPDYLASLKKFKFQTVLLTQSSTVLPSVAVDHAEGGRLVAEHLISMGHTEIGYVGPMTPDEEKLNGFVKQLKFRRIKVAKANMFDTEIGAALSEFLHSLITEKHQLKVSAIFCVNDVFAQKVIEILHIIGYQIPQDIVVVGFDNSLTSSLLNISSISQPMREIAHIGFETMIEQIDKDKKESNYEPQLLLPRWILRESSIQIKVKK